MSGVNAAPVGLFISNEMNKELLYFYRCGLANPENVPLLLRHVFTSSDHGTIRTNLQNYHAVFSESRQKPTTWNIIDGAFPSEEWTDADQTGFETNLELYTQAVVATNPQLLEWDNEESLKQAYLENTFRRSRELGPSGRATDKSGFLNLIRKLEERKQASISTGWEALDQYFTFGGGEVVLVHAKSGVGKTNFACNIAANLARNGKKTLYLSTELQVEVVLGRVAKIIHDVEELSAGIAIKFDPCFSNVTVVCIGIHKYSASDLKQTIRDQDPDLVIIDYVGHLVSRDTSAKTSLNDTYRAIGNEVVSLSIEVNKPILILAQSNRSGADGELSLGDSYSLSHPMHVAANLTDDTESSSRLHMQIWKNRDGQKSRGGGRSGVFDFDVDYRKGRFIPCPLMAYPESTQHAGFPEIKKFNPKGRKK